MVDLGGRWMRRWDLPWLVVNKQLDQPKQRLPVDLDARRKHNGKQVVRTEREVRRSPREKECRTSKGEEREEEVRGETLRLTPPTPASRREL